MLATFERTLTAADAKHNLPFRFQVPAGTSQLTIRLTFSPHTVDDFLNMLTLSVFDTHGWRGAGHRHGAEHVVTIAEQQATHGFVAGAIPAGEWTVVVDTHMVMAGAPCAIRLEVSAASGSRSTSHLPRPSSILRPPSLVARPAWYRGDLHAHTLHSDGSWDVPDLLAWARARGLDFCTLSDHNTVSGLAQIDAACGPELLTMGGMELTTFWGHALALGVREWVDWRADDGAVRRITDAVPRTMPQIAAELDARGGTFVIAHPMSIGDPYCTGCQWRYDDMMPGNARVVEVWNGPWRRRSSNNEDALALVFRWLNAGHRLALTAGTDNHGREPEPVPYGFNVVCAEEQSEPAILRAVQAGHSYLSVAPHLELTAVCGDKQAMMGDALKVVHDDVI
ncbi:MAG: CehA/McbA family metallohydrolase, partial [Chloroflexi bacterium]|nr:CehA/McbA family metallohydrolase [Chloroflexota bacterium]